MTFAPFLSILHHLYHHTSFFEIFGIFSEYVVKLPAFFVCVCLMWDVLLSLSLILYDLWVKLYEYLMRACEKACQKVWPPVNIKTAIFNLKHKNVKKLDIYFLKY